MAVKKEFLSDVSRLYCLPGDIEVAGHVGCSCGLVTGNSSDQGHFGRFIDASRYIHGVTRVNHSHRGHEKQGS